MRIAFMGTPDFAVPALEALHQAGHEIVAVYCQPARPSGRGRKVHPCAVQQYAESINVPVYSPVQLKKQTEEFERFSSLNLDVAVIAAYGLILPSEMLNAPKLGCINIHASLLPRWRGASPIQSSMWAGDTQTGISIMQMDRGLDTGAVYMTKSIPITPTTYAQALHDQLASLGGELILQTLALLKNTPPAPTLQPQEGITYARQLTKEDGKINWALSAIEIDQQIRALTPWPGTYTKLEGQFLKITKTELVLTKTLASPGTVIDTDLSIACGHNQTIRLLEVQMAGKKKMSSQEFLRGNPVKIGTLLGQ